MPISNHARLLWRFAGLWLTANALACSTPEPKVGVSTTDGLIEPHVDEREALVQQLRVSIDVLDDLTDRAETAGLFELHSDPTALVQRRAELQTFWVSFYDAVRSVTALSDYFQELHGDEAFLLGYVGELATYLNLANVMSHAVGHADYEAVLTEGNPSVGLRSYMYVELKNALNLQPWTKPLSVYQLRYSVSQNDYEKAGIAKRRAWAISYIDHHNQEMIERGIVTSPTTFAKDALERLTQGVHWLWFPAQKEVATVMGDTRVVDASRRLISDAQVASATKLLRPGDVIFERRNWYLSNVGLPGFWPHTAFFVGSVAEMQADLGEDFVTQLARRWPRAYAAWSAQEEEGHSRRILEAVSEGVLFSSAEHSLGADFVAAIRPTLSDEARKQVLSAAFAYYGRPYDFDFDFRSDESLVCSEVVYKALSQGAPSAAKGIPLESILGRPVLSPNSFVGYFDTVADNADAPFAFVFFLDGNEQSKSAQFRDLGVFRASHRRPKWDVLQP
jgi:hypothetical protein